jgi:hypothetical protein
MVCLVLLVGVNVADAYRPSLYDVDARVVGFADRHDDRVSIVIKLPPEAVRLHGEPSDWTGIFMENGQPIPGTGFRVRRKIESNVAIAVLHVTDIHGPYVRIFAESGHFPTELSDPPGHPPIDAHVRKATEADDGKTALDLGFGSDVDPGDVTTEWTGVFTKNGHDLPDSTFTITKVTVDGAWALVQGRTYPSSTVRLYPRDAAVNGKRPTPSSSRHSPEPIDGYILAIKHDGEKVVFSIGLGIGVDADAVTTSWVGTFTEDYAVMKGSEFKIDSVSHHIVRAEFRGLDLPSYGVRLVPPGHAR